MAVTVHKPKMKNLNFGNACEKDMKTENKSG